MGEHRKKAGVVLLSLILVCIGWTPSWAITISEIISFVEALPVESFYNTDADIKISVLKELDAVSDTLALKDLETDAALKAQLNQDAISNISVLRDRNSGCLTAGVPDEDDLLIYDCDYQGSFYLQLSELLSQLESS